MTVVDRLWTCDVDAKTGRFATVWCSSMTPFTTGECQSSATGFGFEVVHVLYMDTAEHSRPYRRAIAY